MRVQFFDRQNLENPMNGTWVNGSTELRRLLDRLGHREPFFAELIGENGFKLLLGIGGPAACVQFCAADGSVPYLMAVTHDARSVVEGEIEFLMGDTRSPVPKRLTVSPETMMNIAAHFVEFAERDAGVSWEEV